MATEAEMIAKIATIPLDPDDVTLTVTLQNDGSYWLLSGKYYEVLPGGQKRILYDVRIMEPQT